MSMNIYQNPYISQIISIAIPNKYTKWYCAIVNRALLRATTRSAAKILLGYTEGHHILPKCLKLGGNVDTLNIVYLSGKEHFIVHRLLTKMFLNIKYQHQMENAISKFTCNNRHQKRILTPSQYELCRRYASSAQSSRAVSIETRLKQSIVRKGKSPHNKGVFGYKTAPCSPERANNISKSRKLTKKISCIYCNKETDPGNHKRFHGENCNLGPNADQVKIDRKMIAQQSYQKYIDSKTITSLKTSVLV